MEKLIKREIFKIIFWLPVCGFICGAVLSQVLFYFYGEEPTGLLHFLAVSLFGFMGLTVFSFFITSRVIQEGEDIQEARQRINVAPEIERLDHRIDLLEKEIEDLRKES